MYKAKILIFVPTLGGGGAERIIVNIAKGLIFNNYQVSIGIIKRNDNPYAESLPEEVKLLKLNCKRTRNSLLKLASIIRGEKPDLIFSTLNFTNIYTSLARTISLTKVPIVLREAANRFLAGDVSFLNKIITRSIYNKANKIIALSVGVKRELVEHFKINENNIEVIYNPVDINELNLLRNEIVDDFEFENSKNTIISVSRLHPHKDIITLLKAAKLLKKKINFHLIILGDGPQKELLVNYCDENELVGDVSFLGFKKNAFKYIYQSKMLILSSKYEGFGNVIIEAMALGVPVISTNCPSGPAEIIGENEYGELIEPANHKELADKIYYLLTDTKRRDELKDLGLKRAKDFELQKITSEYIGEFAKFIN